MKKLFILTILLLSQFSGAIFADECIEGNCVNGQGTYTFANGDQYVGEFKDGKKHGQGTYTYADGDTYVGEWKVGLFEDIQPLIAVFGATGRTGRYVLEELSARGARIRALSRNIQKAKETIGGDYQWTQADVTQPETLVMALQDSDIIISTIGAKPGKGPDGPESVVYKGVINLVDEAKRAGTRHIIYMSSIGAGGAENFSTVLLNLFMNKTMKWKSLGEEYIRNSGIDFTIVRPGGLYGDSGTQGIKFDQGDKIIGSIPRGDVASVLVESVYNPDAINKTFEVINDESLPVDAWKDEFKNLKTGEYGKIQSGRLPFSYWGSMLILVLLIVLLIRRRRRRKRAA